MASSSSQPAPAHALPQPSDASIALAAHAADLARAEEDHRFANACRVYHARAAASACVAAHDALFARELTQVPEDRWAHDGDNIERPLDLDATKPLFRVLFKGMASKEVVKPRDPGLAVLAVALCDSRGKVVLRIQKPVEGFTGGRMMLELSHGRPPGGGRVGDPKPHYRHRLQGAAQPSARESSVHNSVKSRSQCLGPCPGVLNLMWL